eukprot:6640030-Prymnesium_polylepis.1
MAHAHGGMRGANMVGDDRDEADAGYRAALRGDAQLANAAGADSRQLGSVAAERCADFGRPKPASPGRSSSSNFGTHKPYAPRHSPPPPPLLSRCPTNRWPPTPCFTETTSALSLSCSHRWPPTRRPPTGL